MNGTVSKPALADALVDVRKAYRVLHGYHRRILDVAALAAQQFEGVSFLASDLACSPFTRKRNPFERKYWGWDATPLVTVNFLFSTGDDAQPDKVRAGDFLVDIGFIADSEFDKAWQEGGEPDPEHFIDARESESLMTLFCIRADKSQREASWLKIWRQTDYPDSAGTPSSGRASTSSSGFTSWYRKTRLEELATRESVIDFARELSAKVQRRL